MRVRVKNIISVCAISNFVESPLRQQCILRPVKEILASMRLLLADKDFFDVVIEYSPDVFGLDVIENVVPC
jgi:hypothetical protein